jgi:hypothetical protein
MSELLKEFEQFAMSRQNPAVAGEDLLTRFLAELSGKYGGVPTFSESDWVALGRENDLSDEQIAALVEQAASWVEDTTDKYEEIEPAEWTGLQRGA